jgi:23S rRNA pseudouridine1911/1915/1917 synthase
MGTSGPGKGVDIGKPAPESNRREEIGRGRFDSAPQTIRIGAHSRGDLDYSLSMPNPAQPSPSSASEPSGPTEVVLGELAAGQRLDRALADALPQLSRMRIQALLAEGHVARDGAAVTDASQRAKAGQRFIITVPPAAPALPEAQDIPLAILFEDADMLVIDKPAGLVVHPGAGNPDRTLVNALLAHCGDSLSGIGGVRRPGIVHRLDKDTSGLMVVAKTDRAHVSLSAQLQARTLKRIYNAVVWKHPLPLAGAISGAIGRSPSNRKRMALVARGGRDAVTHYRTLELLTDAALVECRLETGRTHQIRVHMTSIGHPLIGDPVYGSKRSPKGAPALAVAFPRQALHATQISFLHPVSQIEMWYSSPMPSDMAALVTALSD